MNRIGTAVILFLAFGLANAIDAGKAFDDPEMQARYEEIVSEVRCLVCQNQTIKDSNAFLAGDLRREIRRLMEEGRSDAEIYDFLVTRYGDFVLYRPRMSGKTIYVIRRLLSAESPKATPIAFSVPASEDGVSL